MAKRWLDHGSYPAYAATPTWGVPQDGDGLLQAPSGVASVAQITFSAVPVAGATPKFRIYGVDITSFSTVTSAGSADAAANALATIINGTTTLVPTSVVPNAVSAGTTGIAQLRNLVYARGPAGGAPAGTCQIMARVGSSRLNYSYNTECMITTVNISNVSSTATDQQFKSGVSGCYGYLLNMAGSIWPSGMAQYSYGVWAAQPIGGVPQPGDVVCVRSQLITLPTNAQFTAVMPELGTLTAPVTYVYDDGTEWPQDGSEPVLKLSASFNSTFNAIGFGGGPYTIHRGKQYASGVRNPQLYAWSSSGSANTHIQLRPQPGVQFENFDFYCDNSTAMSITLNATNSYATDYLNCRFSKGIQHQGSPLIVLSSGSQRLNIRGGMIEQRAPTLAQDGILGAMSSSSHRVTLTGVHFKGFLNSALSANNTAAASNSYALVDCIMEGITDYGPSFRSYSNSNVMYAFGTGSIMVSNSSGNQELTYDSPIGFVGWVGPQASYPTLNGRLRNGTPYSFRGVPAIYAAQCNAFTPLEFPRIGAKTTAAANVVKVNLLVEKTLAWTTREISLIVNYTGTDNEPHEESTWTGVGTALTPNMATWTGLAIDPADSVERVKFGNEYFNRYEMQMATKFPIKVGTAVTVQARLHQNIDNSTQSVFVCPQPLFLQV